MKSNSTSRVTEALAILKESAEEFSVKKKPAPSTKKPKNVKKKSSKSR
jgi:hypothetical protein